jgi:NHL repeat/6-bladed beta-propeller
MWYNTSSLVRLELFASIIMSLYFLFFSFDLQIFTMKLDINGVYAQDLQTQLSQQNSSREGQQQGNITDLAELNTPSTQAPSATTMTNQIARTTGGNQTSGQLANLTHINDYSVLDRILKFDNHINNNITFVTSWGRNGTLLGEFAHIHGIAIDSQSNVYALDEAKKQIHKFDSNGTFITAWGGGPVWSSRLEDVDVDLQDNVYIVDYGRDRIYKFDNNGTFLGSLGTNGTSEGMFLRPWGITVDSKGNIYVTDRDNHRVQKFDSQGRFVTSWGMNGTGPARFIWPAGIAVDSLDNVYVVDEKNSNVQKFDSNGTFLRSWGSEGSEQGQFKEPHGIDVDVSGDDDIVYVVDTGNQRVQVFTKDGNHITSFGSKGIGPGQFLFPQDISVDSSRGSLFVSDQKLQHPEKYVIKTFIREGSLLNFTSDSIDTSQ